MQKTPFLKRVLVVNKRLQYTVLIHSIALAVWISILNVFFQAIIMKGFINHKDILFFGIPIAMVVLFSVAILSGLVLTNHIAGPIYRLQQHMEDAIEGTSMKQMEIRKTDYFPELIVPYNKLIAKLKDKS